jgi:nicotinamidase-related amidase
MPAKNRDLYGNASDVAPAVLLLPAADDYFVLKPKRSGFFFTTLDILLEYLRARTLILTGFTADDCVLFTASGAYLRDFHLIVPERMRGLDRSEAHSAGPRRHASRSQGRGRVVDNAVAVRPGSLRAIRGRALSPGSAAPARSGTSRSPPTR